MEDKKRKVEFTNRLEGKLQSLGDELDRKREAVEALYIGQEAVCVGWRGDGIGHHPAEEPSKQPPRALRAPPSEEASFH